MANIAQYIIHRFVSSLQSCLVDIPTPISKSRFSYVHILQFLQRLSATKSSSFSWAPRSCFALGMNSAYRSDGTNIILLKSKELNSVNSFLESLDFCNISFLFLWNSSRNNWGAFRINSGLNMRSRIDPWKLIRGTWYWSQVQRPLISILSF